MISGCFVWGWQPNLRLLMPYSDGLGFHFQAAFEVLNPYALRGQHALRHAGLRWLLLIIYIVFNKRFKTFPLFRVMLAIFNKFFNFRRFNKKDLIRIFII